MFRRTPPSGSRYRLGWRPREPLVPGETYTAQFTLVNEGADAVSALLQTRLTSTFTVGQAPTPPPGPPEVVDALFSFWTNEDSEILTLSTTADVVLPAADNHHAMEISAFVGFDPEALVLSAQNDPWWSRTWDTRAPGDVSPIRVELAREFAVRPPEDAPWDLCCVVPVVRNVVGATEVGAPYCEACPPLPEPPTPDAALPPPDAAPRPDVPLPDAAAPDAALPDVGIPDAAPRLPDTAAVVGDARTSETHGDARTTGTGDAASEGTGGTGCQASPARPPARFGAIALLLAAVGLAGARGARRRRGRQQEC